MTQVDGARIFGDTRGGVFRGVVDDFPIFDGGTMTRNPIRLGWIDFGSMPSQPNRWRELFEQAKKIGTLMTPNELNFFVALRDPVTVYRSCNDRSAEAMSWSVDRGWAEYFARKYVDGYIIQGVVNKDDVIAFFARCDEEKEIVVPPELVRRRTSLPVSY